MERSLSALLPVRNAESTVSHSVAEILDILPELTDRFELILVDDGSSDATIEVADELALVYPQLAVLRHATPRGRTAAIRTGLAHSVGETVFLADEPCPLALNDVQKLWDALEGYEIVLGRAAMWRARWDYGIATRISGGYQLGHRHVFVELAEALDNQTVLLTRLRGTSHRWCEVDVGVRIPGRIASPIPPGRIGTWHTHPGPPRAPLGLVRELSAGSSSGRSAFGRS